MNNLTRQGGAIAERSRASVLDRGRGPKFESRLGEMVNNIYGISYFVYTWLKTMERAYTTEFPETV